MIEATFEALRVKARQAVVGGEFELACRTYGEAEQIARQAGLCELADQAFCYRCGTLLELKRGAEEIPQLKMILLRSQDPLTGSLAAYYTAMAYDFGGELGKAHDYARRAMALVEELSDASSIAATANLLGTLAVRGSHFVEAEEAYRRALIAYRGDNDYERLAAAQVLDNLGYVLMSTEREEPGVASCEQARDAMIALGAQRFLHMPLQDLCFGYLLLDQLEQAKCSGEHGLELAMEIDDRLVVKNLLFLLGEVAIRSGDRFRARRFLKELANYYPELPNGEEFVDTLMGTDLTQVVNLRG